MKQKSTVYMYVTVVLIVLFGTIPMELFSAPKEMTLAALGDCIICRKFSVRKDPGFLELVKIIRSADCTWANCEMPIIESSSTYLEYREMDLPGAHEPWTADELKWLGVDLVGIANNHTMDCGREGLFSTIKNLKRVGIGYAGAGIDLEDASRARYVDTAIGRVGQVNCASTFHKGTQASLPTPYIKGRPGLNSLQVFDILRIKKESFNSIKKILDDTEKYFGWDERGVEEKLDPKKSKKKGKEKKEIKFMDMRFVQGDRFDYMGKHNPKDLERFIASVKIARKSARIVIASIHEHRGGNKGKAPVKFLEDFARACIDAGADVVFNTGPHRLWGIEIYKNKPIFYSLGNFFFEITSDHLTSEVFTMMGLEPDTRDASLALERINKGFFNESCYWESIVPVITFENRNDVTGIKLYPIELGQKKPLYEQGSPALASKERGKAIIQELVKLSKPYKTKIEFQEGAGIIKLK